MDDDFKQNIKDALGDAAIPSDEEEEVGVLKVKDNLVNKEGWMIRSSPYSDSLFSVHFVIFPPNPNEDLSKMLL